MTLTTIRRLILVAILVAGLETWGHHVPEDISGFEPEVNLRIFAPIDSFNALLEYVYRDELDNRKFQSLRLGTYYRAARNFKFGIFGRLQYGERHDEDWRLIEATDTWFWLNTNGRAEFVLVLDATSRALLSPVWIGELKTRYEFNNHNSHHTIKVRPGANWLIRGSDRVLGTMFFRTEHYIPLNYSQVFFYEHWLYIGGLYNWMPGVQVGAQVSYRIRTWTNYDNMPTDLGTPFTFENTASSFGAGLNLIFRL